MSDSSEDRKEHLLERLRFIDAELDRIDHWGAYVGALYEERRGVVHELKAYYDIDSSNYS